MGIGVRIKEAIEKRGISAAELSRRSGVPAGRLSQIVSGKTPNPRSDTISKLSAALLVTEKWLVTGEGERDISPHQEETPVQKTVREHLEKFGEKGEAITESERRAIAMLRSLDEEMRQDFLDAITAAYFEKIEKEQFPEK